MFIVCFLECLTFEVAVTVTELFILRYPVSLFFSRTDWNRNDDVKYDFLLAFCGDLRSEWNQVGCWQ